MKLIKIIFETIKHIVTSSLLIILIVMLLLFIDSYITNSKINLIIEIICIVLFGIYFIYEGYKDITRNHFTTYKYIILSDIVTLIAFMVLCYLQYKRYVDTDDLVMRVSRMRWASVAITCTSFVRGSLKSDKFLIK